MSATERVEQIRARVEVAGVGPWETYDANEGMDRAYAPMWCVANDAFHNPPADEDVEWVGIDVYVGDRDVADFIAHARDDIPFLLAELTRLTALLAEQAATIERVDSDVMIERATTAMMRLHECGYPITMGPPECDVHGEAFLATDIGDIYGALSVSGGYCPVARQWAVSILGSQRTEGQG